MTARGSLLTNNKVDSFKQKTILGVINLLKDNLEGEREVKTEIRSASCGASSLSAIRR